MRKKNSIRRPLSPDPKFNSTLVTSFVNFLMKDGKKSKAYKIFYDTLDHIQTATEQEGLEVWRKALQNVTPSVEVKRRRVGGSVHQVPVEVRPNRKVFLAIKWIIAEARNRSEKTMMQRLTQEIMAAAQGEGGAIKKKADMHRMAEANRAYSYMRF